MGRLAVKSVRANLHCPVSLFQSRSNSFFNRFKPNAPMSNVRLNVRLSRPREFLDSSSPSVRSAAGCWGIPPAGSVWLFAYCIRRGPRRACPRMRWSVVARTTACINKLLDIIPAIVHPVAVSSICHQHLFSNNQTTQLRAAARLHALYSLLPNYLARSNLLAPNHLAPQTSRAALHDLIFMLYTRTHRFHVHRQFTKDVW